MLKLQFNCKKRKLLKSIICKDILQVQSGYPRSTRTRDHLMPFFKAAITLLHSDNQYITYKINDKWVYTASASKAIWEAMETGRQVDIYYFLPKISHYTAHGWYELSNPGKTRNCPATLIVSIKSLITNLLEHIQLYGIS